MVHDLGIFILELVVTGVCINECVHILATFPCCTPSGEWTGVLMAGLPLAPIALSTRGAAAIDTEHKALCPVSRCAPGIRVKPCSWALQRPVTRYTQ